MREKMKKIEPIVLKWQQLTSDSKISKTHSDVSKLIKQIGVDMTKKDSALRISVRELRTRKTPKCKKS